MGAPKCKDLPHPMQPIGFSEDGVIRFMENKIVSFLLEEYSSSGGLSALKRMGFSREDYTHLMQLIGYSVSGYGDLSSSPIKYVEFADTIADELRRKYP